MMFMHNISAVDPSGSCENLGKGQDLILYSGKSRICHKF